MKKYYKDPALIVMAAGMGSRFGGLKQITPLGPSGEMIIDYSVHDALEAGFGRVVFVIKHEIEDAFKELVGQRIEKYCKVDYIFQELDTLPKGFSVPEGRKKPYGTGHAVWCCKDVVKGPFAVINSDDYYGKEGFKKLYDFITAPKKDDKKHIAMAGYILENTLTENGSVSRGVCETYKNGKIKALVERTQIELRKGGPAYTEDGGKTWTPLDPHAMVSMNCWAFPEGVFGYFEKQFTEFMENIGSNPVKGEFYLPFVANSMKKEHLADITVLKTNDRWYGVTYPEDKEKVMKALRKLADDGVYSMPIWDKK